MMDDKKACEAVCNADSANAVSVQLPTFLKGSPAAWFTLLDSHFVIRNVTDPQTKFHHVMAKLGAEVCEKILKFLRKKVMDDSYNVLKGCPLWVV